MICLLPTAIDGDTIVCFGRPAHVRLLGIDAPELPGHCRRGRVCTPGDGYASRDQLRLLIGGAWVTTCTPGGRDRYGRTLARCGRPDLSCLMLASGQAVRRYRRIDCP